MKIGNSSVTPGSIAATNATGTRAASEGGRASAPAAANSESSTKVELSSAAKALMDNSDGAFDAGKVERVRQSISDGTYKVNAEAIADKLISNAQDLLGKIDTVR